MTVEIATSPGGAPLDPAEWAPSRLRAARPDADVRALMLRLSLYPARPGPEYSLRRARRDWQLAIKAFGSREGGIWVSERQIPGQGGEIRLRIYSPAGGDREGPRPILIWMHGGGFVLGDLYTAGGTCRALANRSGAIVVAVDYRLAPEHDLSAAHEDCLMAVRWLAEHAEEIGGDPTRLAVGGDSAGGALAACAAQRCAEQGLPLAAQVLIYPATHLEGEYPSNTENGSGYMLTGGAIDWFRLHLRGVSALSEAAFSPLLTPELSNLPPSIIVTAGFDPIRDEGLAYAWRLREAGIAARTFHYCDQIHGFLSFDRVLRKGRDALARVGESLAQVFADGSFHPEYEAPHVVDGDSRFPLTPREFAQRWHEARVVQLMAADWIQGQAFAALRRTQRLATQRPRR